MKSHPGSAQVVSDQVMCRVLVGRGVCVCVCVCVRTRMYVCMHSCVGMESVSRSVWKYCSKLGGAHVGKSEGLSGRDASGW